MVTKEKINAYNEIYKKLVDLNLEIMFIDQQLKKLIEKCSKRHPYEVWFLNIGIEKAKTNHENMKKKLLEMLNMKFFQSQCFDINGNIENFILDQEVYNLLSTKRRKELKFLMRRIGGFLTRSRGETTNVIYFTKELDQMPKKSNYAYVGQSGDETQRPQPHMEIMSLSEVVIEMYGFSRDMALDIKKSVANRSMVSEAFKNESMSDDLHTMENGFEFDPLDYLDHEFLSENCEQEEDADTQNWKNVALAKQKFQHLSETETYYEDVLKAMKNWVFHIESIFCDLVYNLYAIMSGYEPAMIKFQTFNHTLNQEKKHHPQMVPIIVYKILAFPKVAYEGTVTTEKAVLLEEIEFEGVMQKFVKAIKILGFVLRKSSGILDAQIRDKRVLTSYQTMLNLCEGLLGEIGLKIYGARSRLEGCRVESIAKKI